MVNRNLSVNLKYLRKATGLTQAEMSADIDIDIKAYAKYEEGRSEPTIDTLIRISEYYGITVDELVKVKIKNK